MRRILKVQTSHRPRSNVIGDTALSKNCRQSKVLKFVQRECTSKKTSLVYDGFGLKDICAGNFGRIEVHLKEVIDSGEGFASMSTRDWLCCDCCQTFHGALSRFHNSFNCALSR